jgi:hypothetical protein
VERDEVIRTNVLLILEKYINSRGGTDGRPIIRKHTSVTGSHNGPLLLFRFVSPVISSKSTSILASAREKWTPKETHENKVFKREKM